MMRVQVSKLNIYKTKNYIPVFTDDTLKTPSQQKANIAEMLQQYCG